MQRRCRALRRCRWSRMWCAFPCAHPRSSPRHSTRTYARARAEIRWTLSSVSWAKVKQMWRRHMPSLDLRRSRSFRRRNIPCTKLDCSICSSDKTRPRHSRRVWAPSPAKWSTLYRSHSTPTHHAQRNRAACFTSRACCTSTYPRTCIQSHSSTVTSNSPRHRNANIAFYSRKPRMAPPTLGTSMRKLSCPCGASSS